MLAKLTKTISTSALAVTAAIGCFSTSAHAATDCAGTIINMYTGDNVLWITYRPNVATSIYQSGYLTLADNPNVSGIVTAAQIAHALGSPMSIRYAGDGVNCGVANQVRGDVEGITY